MTELQYFDAEGNNLTELDLSQNTQLEILFLEHNNLSMLDVSHIATMQRIRVRDNELVKFLISPEAVNMELIYCDGNLLDACALDSLYMSLPTSSTDPYLFLEVNGEGTNPGNTTSTTTIATEKGWNVVKWQSTGNYVPIVGDGTGCITGINELSDIQLSVYPNPTSSEIHLQSGEMILSLEVINMLGQIVERVENIKNQSFQLNIGNQKSGMYMLKVVTQNGYTTQKVMLR